jgi:hypothetical protein
VVRSSKELLELLLKMEPHIQKRKPKPSKENMAEIAGSSWPEEYTKALTDLDKLIGRYKFQEAQEILESLITKLKGED